MLKAIITITFLIGIAIAELPYEHSCDYLGDFIKRNGNNLSQFDVEKYTGKWFVTSYVVNSWRTIEIHSNHLQCQSLTYQLNADKNGYHIQANNSIVPDTEKYHSHFYENWVNATTEFDTEKSSRMKMMGKNKPGDMQGLLILDTDYNNYAIEYVCMSYDYKMIRLITRTTDAPSATLRDRLTDLVKLTELRSRSIHSLPLLNCK